MIKEIENVSKEEILRNLPEKEKSKGQFYYCPKKRFFQREVLDSQTINRFLFIVKLGRLDRNMKKVLLTRNNSRVFRHPRKESY